MILLLLQRRTITDGVAHLPWNIRFSCSSAEVLGRAVRLVAVVERRVHAVGVLRPRPVASIPWEIVLLRPRAVKGTLVEI